MTSRRTGFSSTDSAIHRKQSVSSPSDRAESKSVFGNMTVTSLRSRLAPSIQAAVDTLLGEVVLVLNETQQELVNKEQENQRLKVRLEVSERELKSLQECLCSAQKLIDQLQVSYPQPQFTPSLSSMASMAASLDRNHQNSRGVNGAGVDLGLGGAVEESLHGFGSRDDFKMCQLSIQPDGSVTNHSLDSFSTGSDHICSDPGRPDQHHPRAPGSAFVVKEEHGHTPGPALSQGKESTLGSDTRVGEVDHSSQTVGDLGYGPLGDEGGSHRTFPHPTQRPPRRAAECGSALAGAEGQKGDSQSPGRTEDLAGPSESAAEPPADRPHHCLECGKTFRLISSLKKHIRIHTGEKPYPCGVCGRRFRESGALKTHLRIHTGEKPYSCSECGTSFRHLDGLRKHRRTHTGEKPYVCAICGKRLSRLQHLKHHQLIHTGERPCCCPFCNRSFKEPAALRKHVRTHRDEGGHMSLAVEDTDPDALEDMNNLHPAAPSPQMRFGEWGGDEDDASAVDCV
ncbi:uncharacterized protein ACB057_013307 [Neosynchiropus ocellatus]